jgi:hypothetical protein
LTCIANSLTLIGNTEQYNGFFRLNYNGFRTFGQFGISQPALCSPESNVVYAAGYSSGLLVKWLTDEAWDAVTNPEQLGNVRVIRRADQDHWPTPLHQQRHHRAQLVPHGVAARPGRAAACR